VYKALEAYSTKCAIREGLMFCSSEDKTVNAY